MSTITVSALHVAKGRRLPMRPVDTVDIETQAGIVGDRYHGSKHRQVSVQSLDDLLEAADLFGSPIPPGLTRRNITVTGGSVPREPGSLLRIGDVLLEVVRVAAPCKLLDDTIGRGAQAALRRRAGSVCRVLDGGAVTIGDRVAFPDREPVLPTSAPPVITSRTIVREAPGTREDGPAV